MECELLYDSFIDRWYVTWFEGSIKMASRKKFTTQKIAGQWADKNLPR